MLSIQSAISVTNRVARILPASGWVLVLLIAIALLSRLTLLSVSLEEVDSANFVNALLNGYNIPLLRPHPPGYPVYVFLAWLLNLMVDNPHLTLTLLSAVFGSLSVVPLFLILKDQTDLKFATVGSLLFLANPLFWSFSEAALSDVPSMFFVLVLAWLSLRARTSTAAFLLTCGICSLTIGLRQANIFALIFVVFPVACRLISDRRVPWTLGAAGTAVLIATTFAWALPMVFLGSEGFLDYAAAFGKQWSEVVKVSDIAHVEAPALLNAIIRIERFGTGYLLSHLWLGGHSNDLVSLMLLLPWVFGFALFMMGLRRDNSGHLLMALWVASVIYTIVAIHFLPRYGLAQFPAFLITCLIGYRFLATQLAIGKLRLEALVFLVLGCVLLIGAIKLQPPLPAFEVSPPPGSLTSLLLVLGGTISVLAARYLQFRSRALRISLNLAIHGNSPVRWLRPETVILVGLMLLALPVALKGFTLASIAHSEVNPIQRMVASVKDTYGTQRVKPCWDSQTHSFFELADPGLIPVGYWSADELFDAHRAGYTIVVTDKCQRYEAIEGNIGLVQAGQFSGDSPLWAKNPTMTLYAAAPPMATGSSPEEPLIVASSLPVAAYVELPQEEPNPPPAVLVTAENGSNPPKSLVARGSALDPDNRDASASRGLDPPMSLAARGTSPETENSDVTANRGLDPPVSLFSRRDTGASETNDIQRMITVEPLTDGPPPSKLHFFGVPTVVALSVLALLVSISLIQVIRTW